MRAESCRARIDRIVGRLSAPGVYPSWRFVAVDEKCMDSRPENSIVDEKLPCRRLDPTGPPSAARGKKAHRSFPLPGRTPVASSTSRVLGVKLSSGRIGGARLMVPNPAELPRNGVSALELSARLIGPAREPTTSHPLSPGWIAVTHPASKDVEYR